MKSESPALMILLVSALYCPLLRPSEAKSADSGGKSRPAHVQIKVTNPDAAPLVLAPVVVKVDPQWKIPRGNGGLLLLESRYHASWSREPDGAHSTREYEAMLRQVASLKPQVKAEVLQEEKLNRQDAKTPSKEE